MGRTVRPGKNHGYPSRRRKRKKRDMSANFILGRLKKLALANGEVFPKPKPEPEPEPVAVKEEPEGFTFVDVSAVLSDAKPIVPEEPTNPEAAASEEPTNRGEPASEELTNEEAAPPSPSESEATHQSEGSDVEWRPRVGSHDGVLQTQPSDWLAAESSANQNLGPLELPEPFPTEDWPSGRRITDLAAFASALLSLGENHGRRCPGSLSFERERRSGLAGTLVLHCVKCGVEASVETASEEVNDAFTLGTAAAGVPFPQAVDLLHVMEVPGLPRKRYVEIRQRLAKECGPPPRKRSKPNAP